MGFSRGPPPIISPILGQFWPFLTIFGPIFFFSLFDRAEGFGRSLTPILTAPQALAAHDLPNTHQLLKMAQNRPKMVQNKSTGGQTRTLDSSQRDVPVCETFPQGALVVPVLVPATQGRKRRSALDARAVQFAFV